MQHPIKRTASWAAVAVASTVFGFPLAGLSVGVIALQRADATGPSAQVALVEAVAHEAPGTVPTPSGIETAVDTAVADASDRSDAAPVPQVPLGLSFAAPHSNEPSVDMFDAVQDDLLIAAAETPPEPAPKKRPRVASKGSVAVSASTEAAPRPVTAATPQAPPAQPTVSANESAEPSNDPWAPVRWCESRNRYGINTGNGFFGAYQFTISTWNWVAGLVERPDLVGVRPDLAAPADQDRLAQALAFEVRGGGLGHWPVCGKYYGS